MSLASVAHQSMIGASSVEIATAFTSVAVFVVASLTLWFTYPKRAKLDVSRLSELDNADLIFFVYPSPKVEGEPQIPRDYLLQLQVAIANVGRRKAVLSTISVEDFTTEAGEMMYLPESVQGSIWGSQRTVHYGWSNGQRVLESIGTPGPFVLAPDDVVVIQFRSRRGIDWSGRWDLPALSQYCQKLTSTFVSARVKIQWRRGGKLQVGEFPIELDVRQQDVYVRALKELTADLTMRPAIDASPIAIE
ncbi:MAG: hypothetical protein WB565_00185 [Acidimicrobiales bacterium]